MDELSSEILKKLTGICPFPEVFRETEPIKGGGFNAPPAKSGTFEPTTTGGAGGTRYGRGMMSWQRRR